MKRSAV